MGVVGGELLVTLGAILVASVVTDAVASRLRLPRVTFLVLLGVGIGPSGLDLLPSEADAALQATASVALTMVAFLLGGDLSSRRLRVDGRRLLLVTTCVVVATMVTVASGLLLLGWHVAVAFALAGVATATDPLAVREVVREGSRRDRLTRTLLGVVAIDDAWAIVAFGLLTAVAAVITAAGEAQPLAAALQELAGSVLLGVSVGVPAAVATGYLRPGEPTLVEAAGVVLVLAGAAALLHVSPLLAAMSAGVCVANLARHHKRSFSAIEQIDWPFLVFFFVLAGTRFDMVAARDAAPLVIAYVGLRAAGRLLGGWSAYIALRGFERADLGLALLPQAGVAIGMALVAADRFPAHGEAIMATTLASTVVFELFGPLLTRYVVGAGTKR